MSSTFRGYDGGLLNCHAADNVADSTTHTVTGANEEILNILKVMSHDIRGPLISLGAVLKLLKRGAYGNMDASPLETMFVRRGWDLVYSLSSR